MNIPIGIFFAASPWLFGAAAAVLLLPRFAQTPRLGTYMASVGLGGYLGYIVLGLTLLVIDRFGLTAFNITVVYAFGFVTMVALCMAFSHLFRNRRELLVRSPETPLSLSGWFLFALLAGLIIMSVYSTLWLPGQAWDNFSFWSTSALSFIDHSISLDNRSGSHFIYEYRHPLTLPVISAWSAWSSTLLNGVTSGFWPWLFVWLSIGLVVMGYALEKTSSLIWSYFLSLAALSIPLVENHALLAGYGEIWIAIALAGGCSVTAIGLEEQNLFKLFTGLLLSSTAVFFKGSGVFYAALPFAALSIILLFRLGPRGLFLALGTFSLILLYIIKEGATVTLLGNVYGFDAEEKQILFGGRGLSIYSRSVFVILENQMYSWIINLSFSVSFLLFCLLSLSYTKRPANIQTVFLLITFGLGIALISLSQLSDHGLRFALVNRDTGNTRFLMPLFPLIFLALASDNLLQIENQSRGEHS